MAIPVFVAHPANEQVNRVADHFSFAQYGYRLDKTLAPVFHFGAMPETGAKLAVPVERIR